MNDIKLLSIFLWSIFLFEPSNHIYGINLPEKEIQDNPINTIYSDDPKLSYVGRFATSGK